MSLGWNYPPRPYLEGLQYIEAVEIKYAQRVSPETHPIYPYAQEIIIASSKGFIRSAAIDIHLKAPLSKQHEVRWTFAGVAPVQESVQTISCLSANRTIYTIGFVYPFMPDHPLILTLFSTNPITVQGIKLKPFYEATSS